ncbi:MAG: phosphate signaling complex protein PhoU [Anaerolineales bacterium]|nr:phosphate signaling complex protein PhoU [Anaerolineales bacterium]
MPRGTFERELRKLQDQIISLGSIVEENIVKAVECLRLRDAIQSERLIKADLYINEQRIKIALDALTLIATQQPIAGDMRVIAAVMEIVGELERIHDYVKGIGKISLMLHQNGPVASKLTEYMPEMAEKARDMLHQSLTAFANRDAALARQIPPLDDEVDELYKQLYRDLIQYIMAHPEETERSNLVEWAAHNLERTADRVTNICEWVVYMVDGKYLEMDSELEAPPDLSASR